MATSIMQHDSSKHGEPDEMLPEYDFSKGARGRYAKRYAEGSNVVVLAPDVAQAFHDAEAVNTALRALIAVARQNVVPQTQ